MWNLRTENGFTLIEVLISLSLFAMLFCGALTIKLSELKLERSNNYYGGSFAYFEGLKGVASKNLSYNDISYLRNSSKIYVSKDNMDYELLKGDEVSSIFTEIKPEEYPYIAFDIQGEEVLNVTMVLHSRIYDKEEVFTTRFYKGRYKR